MANSWGEVGRKHGLDDETIKMTETLIDTGLFTPFYKATSLEAAREEVERVTDAAPEMPFDGTIQYLSVPGIDANPCVPVYVYIPENLPAYSTILLFFHGGGLVIVSARSNSTVAKIMARDCGVIIVDVEYRLLPNPQDPLAPFNDAVTVAKWVLANKKAVGGSEGSRVGLAGDSAGGQIACCVTRDVKGIDFQILIYPVTSLDLTMPSVHEFFTTPVFCGESMEKMFQMVLPDVPDGEANPRFNPSANPNLDASPPTLILSAELDPLVDWGASYEEKLRAAGVKVKRIVYEGIPHAFHAFPLMFPKACARSHTDISTFLKSLNDPRES